VNVSKAFFAVLLSKQQNVLLDDDIRRLALSQQDTYAQYKSGVTDKTDYERASIALNNARAAKKQASEALKTSLSFLKEQMGYPSERNLAVQYDTTRMESELQIDTTQALNPENRIEYQLLQTQRSLLQSNINYNYWSFLPSFSAFGNYNLNYLNNNFNKLYAHDYPSSFIGLQLSFPIFQGGRRYQEIRIAQLELSRSDFDVANLRDVMNTQYTEALASYKSNLNSYYVLKENLNLANNVYNTIQLQYKAGVKTYLDVITAETDLRTTQINYINALFQVLSSKLDVQRALGTIHY
jgi:outer membrane protein TolC